MDSRPGSATSLLRTVIGLCARSMGGWMAVANIVELMNRFDIPGSQTRTALSRVKSKGLVRAEKLNDRQGYAIEPSAEVMLARGDRRIYHPRSMQSNDRWCVIAYTFADEERQKREQLRRRLRWIGCGSIGPGLAICPDFLRDEVIQILEDLDISDGTTLFTSDRPIVRDDLSDAVAQWWDLDSIAKLHTDFLESCTALATSSTDDPRGSFTAFVLCIDSWRVIPYLDPGLPRDLLPPDWPGDKSIRLFTRIRDRHESAARQFIASMTIAP